MGLVMGLAYPALASPPQAAPAEDDQPHATSDDHTPDYVHEKLDIEFRPDDEGLGFADEDEDEPEPEPEPDSEAEPDTEEPEAMVAPAYTRRETIPGLYPENTGMFVGKGIWAGTPDRRFTLRMAGFLHLDTRFTATLDRSAGEAELFIRRARFTLDGRLFGQLEYRVMWDQLVDPVIPYDFHIDWRPIPQFNIRVGGFKSPFGFERRGRSYALLFIERGMPTALAPNRDMGLFFYGQSRNGFFSYDVAAVSGAEDLATRYGFNGSPDFTGRVYFQPFRLGKQPGRHFPALKNFGVGMSWTLGVEYGSEDDPRLGSIRAMPRRSAYGGRLLFRYTSDEFGATLAHGLRDRQSVHGHWHHGRYQTLFEYTRSAQRVARGFDDAGTPLQRAYLAHHAWQGVFSVNLSGDENTFFGVSPSRPFNLSKRQWGSATTSFRYHEIYMDRGAFPQFADPELWAHTVRAVGSSLQWHITARLEAQLEVEWMVPQGTVANLPTDFAVMTRFEARY